MFGLPLLVYALYALPLAALVTVYVRRRRRLEARHRRDLQSAISAGLTEPPSLHPVIDPLRCIGSASCTQGLPGTGARRHRRQGIPHQPGRVHRPWRLRGRRAPSRRSRSCSAASAGASRSRCVKPDFETNVPGIFIAGELGGMGLIRKAVRAGTASDRAIAAQSGARARLGARRRDRRRGARRDRRRPCGHERSFATRVIEQEAVSAAAVYHYPRKKIVMTAPVELPLVGRVQFDRGEQGGRCSRSGSDIVERAGSRSRYGERMERIERRAARDDVRGAIDARELPRARRAARDRAPRHAAQARRAGRGAAQGRLPPRRRRAVPRPARARGGRRRQRARGCAALARKPGTRRDALLPGRRLQRVRPRTARLDAASAAGRSMFGSAPRSSPSLPGR